MVPPLTGVRVLVVDDLEQNRKLMHAVLEPHGFLVRSEASGAAALVALGECDVDVVLLDVLMPVMDGYETCARIKADARTAMLPVVMVTASGARAAAARARGRRRRLRHQAVRPGRAHGAGAVAGAGQAAPRHRGRADRRARALERRARVAGRRAGRRARAAGPAAPLPLAAARRAHRRVGRRVVPREPPPRDHHGLHRPARLHRVRRDVGAGGDDGGAPRVPRRARRARLRATRGRSSTSPATG